MKWNKQMQRHAREQRLKRKDKCIASKQRLVEQYQPMISDIDFVSFFKNMEKFAQNYIEMVKRVCEEMNRRLLEYRGEYIEKLPKETK